MEWRGINLSDFRQQRWLKQNLNYLAIIALSILCALVFDLFFYMQAVGFAEKNAVIQEEINQYRKKNEKLLLQINQLKVIENIPEQKIKTENILLFIQYLSHLNIQGGLDIVKLYQDGETKLKLTGVLVNQNDFTALEKQLIELGYSYQIEQLQLNDKQHTEFHLNVSLEKKDEK